MREGRRKRSNGGVPALAFDATFGEPWRVAASEAWTSGDWQQLDRLFAQAPDPATRSAMLRLAPEPEGDTLAPWLDQWVEQQPASAVARAARGMARTVLAWKIRGGGRASLVGHDAFDCFHAHLRVADAELMHGVRLDQDEPLVWETSLITSMGLGVALDETWDRYRHVERLVGTTPSAAHQMLQVLAPKWWGSVDQMREFALAISAGAPVGDPIHSLVARCHIEVMVDDDRWAPNQWGAHEIVAALDRSRLLDPTQRLDPLGFAARNEFAFALHLFGDQRAAELLAILGWNPGRLTEDPWYYFGDAAEVIWTVGCNHRLW